MNKQLQQKPVWCFRRWSRKPWSAFAGLCRLKIGVLSVAMSIILLATHIAGAQTVGTDTLSRNPVLLDSVRVTARHSAVAVTQITVPQTRLLVDQKGTAPLGTAEAVLRLLPEIDVRERGGKAVQADIAIRGGSFDQTMVMLNGIDFSDARTGHQSHSLPVDIDLVSDISVIDVTSQPGALAGAVDFRTDPFAPRFLRVKLEGGAWGYAYGNVSGALTENFSNGDRLTALAAGSYRRSDGYRPNTDFWNLNAYSRILYDSRKAGSFDVQGGFQRRDWGSNGFYSLAYPMQFESTLTGIASARWVKTWNHFTLSASGSFRRNNDRFEMVRGNPDPARGGIPFNYHTTYNIGGEIYGSYEWQRAGTTSLGVNYIRHSMFSTAMGEVLDDPSHRIPTLDGRDYPKGVARQTVGGWAGHHKSWNRLWVHALAGVQHSDYGTDGTFGATGGWQIDRTFSLIANVSRSTRLPTFTDLYYNVVNYVPDPHLKPETAMTYRLTGEAAGKLGGGNWRATASVYYRDTRGVIDWEQNPGLSDPAERVKWRSIQLGRLGSVGAELKLGYTSKGWLRAAMLNYGYIHNDKSVRRDRISKYALDYMRHKVSAVVSAAIPGGFTVSLTGSFYDRVGSWLDAGGVQTNYKPYFLLDGRLAWERGWVQLYVDVTNMTDTRYYDFGGLAMPGPWASGGVVITIR